ncbi:MAG: hypothetical protein NBV67_08715 [Tagaea sp.]|nr:hypothetical protein [Tagaea sp.]
MRLLLWTMCLALLAGSAAAQNRPALRFDPNKIEFATPWAQSSPCLADRTDPLCTAHAIIVCEIFSRRPECADFPNQHKFSNPQGWTRVEYKIVEAGFMSREAVRRFDVETSRERLEQPTGFAYVAPGNLQARILTRRCGPGASDCEAANWDELMIVSERRRERWEFSTLMLFFAGRWLVD